MVRKKIQVSVPGGIHMAIASALSQTVRTENIHVFLKAGKKMASIREPLKVLALGVHAQDWVEIIADCEGEEESVIEQMEKILCKK